MVTLTVFHWALLIMYLLNVLQMETTELQTMAVCVLSQTLNGLKKKKEDLEFMAYSL